MTRHRIHLLLPLAVLACNQPEAAPYPDEPNAASSSRSSPAATSSSAPATPSGPQAQLADMDHRTPVPLQPMMAWHQKQNMMDHLVAIQRITDGLARDDWDAVAEASKLIESSPQMQQMCQHMGAGAEGFTKLALAFHSRADAIGNAAEAKDGKAVLEATAHTLEACTSCHATYKQDIVDAATWQARTGSVHDPSKVHVR